MSRPLPALALLFVVLATSCVPSYRLYRVTQAGESPAAVSDSTAATPPPPVEIVLDFGYALDAGAVAVVTNHSERRLLLDAVNSHVLMNGYSMRLSDAAEFAFDGFAAEERFAGLAMTPRDGILYPRVDPGASVAFPVPALRLGACADPPDAHCAGYEFAFVVLPEEGKPADTYRRDIEAVATDTGRLPASAAGRSRGPVGTYVARGANGGRAGGGSEAAGVLVGIVLPAVVAVAVTIGE